MRDPARIPKICALLERTWLTAPDMRLGQLVVNAIAPASPCPGIFYAEDSRTRRGLQRVLEHGAAPPELPDGSGVSLAWQPVKALRPTTLTFAGASVASFELGPLLCELLELRFGGEYRHGSQGTPDAQAMVAQLCPLLARVEPDVVVLDLSQLRYAWGDNLLQVYDLIGRFDADHPLAAVTLGGTDSLAGLRSLGIPAHEQREAALAEARQLALARAVDIG